ncbi:hypothetical protein A1O3_08575 [Capronia epimyces CBS 606.96]|uniref:G-patch domain-containing protein n=1 Tax=Capronia epimyces CBS 606.96 TaxID=1182542 RepID=W9Y9K9_9EURO|nr:uncharacterized protein A1O3_08575 [Capronia epimyces CBS 606.96]EXJ79074.1 hypothetical protein A1O3_08575 [Capronia epimyces CBS 606.96]
MAKHGWKEGQSLGNRNSIHVGISDVDRLAAARVGVLFKDDNLGLGAKRKSKDVEAQRTGLDAFQGLLGRLNGKSDAELKKQEQKVEDRKLAMYVRGRWGGMVFVRGGVLVGDRQKEETVNKAGEDEIKMDGTDGDGDGQDAELGDKDEQRREEEKRRRKEERRIRREEKASRKAAKKAKREAREGNDKDSDAEQMSTPAVPVHSHKSPLTRASDEPVSSADSASETEAAGQKRKRGRSSTTIAEKTPAEGQRQKSVLGDMNVTQQQQSGTSVRPATTKLNLNLRNGRHLLRGRNIQAKKMAFSDLKGLDEIFMRPG